jgi:hypothetical protein
MTAPPSEEVAVNATRRTPRRVLGLTIPVLVLVACGSTTPSQTAATASQAAPSEATVPLESSPASTAPAPAASPSSPVVLGPGSSLDPAAFVPEIDNPWFPLKPGTSWTYRGVKDGVAGVDTMTVTTGTKVVAGVSTVVVHDELVQRGKVRERTDDYYVQDQAGNVWYFGEATAELDDTGKVTSTEGSWLTGVDGAMPGVIMPADPQVGVAGAQEIYPGQAEDHYVVLLTNAKVKVPAGSYGGALITAEWTPLEPAVLSEKAYAKGVGEVSESDVKGGDEKFELVRVTRL